jgi:dephospho-CoA kinase
MARCGLSAEEVREIMATQLQRTERLRRADDVLANDGDLPALHRRVAQLHAKYLDLARMA